MLKSALILFFGRYVYWIFLLLIPVFYFRDRWERFWLNRPRRQGNRYTEREDRQDNVLALRLLLAWLVSEGLVHGIKFVFPTQRPFVAQDFVPFLGQVDTSSFPSGHTTIVIATAVTVLFRYQKLGVGLLLVGLLVGIARVLGGVHYPLDIIGGVVLGTLVAFFVQQLIVYRRH